MCQSCSLSSHQQRTQKQNAYWPAMLQQPRWHRAIGVGWVSWSHDEMIHHIYNGNKTVATVPSRVALALLRLTTQTKINEVTTKNQERPDNGEYFFTHFAQKVMA